MTVAISPETRVTTTSNGVAKNVQEHDRFRFGWRTRPRITPEGKVEYERIPLTAYDILHPQEGDFRVHNDEHHLFCRYLDNVISAQVADIPGAVVLHDTRIAWDVPNLDAHGPDIALIFGVRERKKWGTFDVSVEGTRPALIIEITSPETRRLDLDDKPEEYALAGVLVYIIVDAHKTSRQPNYRLIGYELTPDGYVNLAPDTRGRLWLEPAQLWLGLQGDLIQCYDVHDNRLGDYVEIAKAYKEAEARAEAEAQARIEAEARAEAAEARAQALEEEIRRLRGAAN
ncbi:MAG: Uma2 family endonuclease [Caldilinea sp. CFX5]|nr:Uma2 family endonuclease [Caldilinea sp. CFX5]